MHLLGTLLLMLAGTIIGFYVYLPPPPDAASTLAEVTRISVAPDRFAQSITIAKMTPARPDEASALQQKSAAQWTAVVTTGPSAQTPLKSSRPGDAMTRYELARDLQRELKRAGCYGGEITGAWSPSTKRAMAAFMDRVNSTLPIDEPDYILLTLVQGNAGASCSAECRSGEVTDEHGRCVPHAVVAQAVRKSERAEARRLAQLRSAGQEGRMANAADIGKPQLSDARSLATNRIAANTASRVAPNAAPEILPWQQAGIEPPAPVPAQRPQRLPGMMSVGAPLAAPVARPAPEPAWKEAALDTASFDATAVEPLPPREMVDPSLKAKSAKRKASADARPKRYTSNYARKGRRGDPRPGTIHYNVLQSLGGIY